MNGLENTVGAILMSLALGCGSDDASPQDDGGDATTSQGAAEADSSAASSGSPTATGDTTGTPPSASSTSDGDSDDGGSSSTRDILVDDVESLRAALVEAQPGDRIMVAPGRYEAPDVVSVDYLGSSRAAYFYAASSGTPDDPIVVQSRDPEDKAELVGLGFTDSAYLLWIRGGHWVVRDLVLRDGGKGLMLDEASDSIVDALEVYDIGDEAIHLRSGTSRTRVSNCIIDGAGLNQPGFGEGIYIGSDGGQWDVYDRACNDNTITSCVIRGTRAEAVDIKEGTTGNVVENCEIDGGDISGENYADSFIDLKGDGARVRGNVFAKRRNSTVTRGVAIVERPQGPTATHNWIYENHFEMDDASGFMVHAYAGADNYAWDNTRTPEGDEYSGSEPELYLEDPR